ncbi:MAG: peptidoglycan DD-metalloendopeptidase family protein [Emergencia sp.]
MRQTDKKKGKDKAAAALMLCFCLIALTSIFTIKASIDKISGSASDVPVTKKESTQTQETQPDAETGAGTEAETESQADTEASAKVPTVDSRGQSPKTDTFICPVEEASAVLSKKYSMDMVIYNMTLDQYMTHPGVDLEAPSGSCVKAAADGTITDICTDDAYGITIEISHGNGFVTRYCNLATDKLAEKGDTVRQGQIISNVGKTALYESMEKTHLHFEILKDGKLCDPAKYINFSSL